MNKVKIFSSLSDMEMLEEKINLFARDHKILNVSISTVKYSSSYTYVAAVVYSEKENN